MMRTKITDSLQIIEMPAKNGGDGFFMLFDNSKTQDDKDKVFFGFRGKMDKKSWELLRSGNFKNFKEIEIEYESTKKDDREKNSVKTIIGHTLLK